MRVKNLKLVVSTSLRKLSNQESKDVVSFLTTITGQLAVPTKFKKSVSNFGIRKGMFNGGLVTLRGESVIDFLKKVVLFILPVDSTFKGFSKKILQGNTFNFGIINLHNFPEITESLLVKGVNLAFSCKSKLEIQEVITMVKLPIRGI